MTRTLPKAILSRHVGIERGWAVAGKCHWEKIEGWRCLVDEAGAIHQVHGDPTPSNTLQLHEASGDWY